MLKRTALFFLLIATVAFQFACSSVSSASKPVTVEAVSTSPSPSPSPEKGLSEFEISMTQRSIDALRQSDDKSTQEAAELQGPRKAFCTAEWYYKSAKELVDDTTGKNAAEVAKLITAEEARTLLEKQVGNYSKLLLQSAATVDFIECGEGGGGTIPSLLSELSEDLETYKILIQKTGSTAAQMRGIALQATIRQLKKADVYDNIRSKTLNEPADSDEDSPLDMAKEAFRMNNPWEFTPKELGFTQAEGDLLESY